jgi:tetratricopeptide (TPR) repeat protein
MKALEKDRNRRYETASAFAADVGRYLKDEPVQACTPSPWYRVRKFARRKKTALAMAAWIFVALAGMAGGVGWAIRDKGAREEGIERERLAREEALDQAVGQTLDETGALIEQGKWPEALAVVERADKLLAAAGRTERPARLLELRKELTMAERLDGIYRGSIVIVSTRHESEHAGPLWSFEDESVWGREQDVEFTKAFRDFEIDVDALPPTETAAQITRCSTRPALLRALDEWAAVRRRDRGENDPGWKKLAEIARQADPDPWRNRCREALLRHDRQALEQLADAVPIRQVPPATLCLLGITLKEVGGLDKAMGLLRRAQQQYPDDLWLNHTLGYFSCTAFQPPRLDDALRFYTVVSALRPRFAPIHLILGNTLMNKGAPDAAITEFSKAIELDPKNPTYWQQRGWNYQFKLHQPNKAIEDLSEAIDLSPKHVQALTDRVAAYIALRQYDKALLDLNKAIGILEDDINRYPDKPQLRVHRAWSYSHLAAVLIASKQLDEAEKAYRNAIAAWGKLADHHNVAYNSDLLGFLLNERGKFSQAAHAFRQAMTLWQKLHADSGNEDYRRYASLSHAWLIQALAAQARQIEKDGTLSDGDRREKAQACRTEARALVQDGLKQGLQTPVSVNNTGWGLATDLNPANRDPALAIELAKLAVEREPKQGRWWNTLGAAQYRARDWKAAIEALNKSMELRNGGDSFDWFFLAMANWQLGEKEKARTWFDQAIQWMDKHQSQNEELRRFRGEAAELLRIKDGKK